MRVSNTNNVVGVYVWGPPVPGIKNKIENRDHTYITVGHLIGRGLWLSAFIP